MADATWDGAIVWDEPGMVWDGSTFGEGGGSGLSSGGVVVDDLPEFWVSSIAVLSSRRMVLE